MQHICLGGESAAAAAARGTKFAVDGISPSEQQQEQEQSPPCTASKARDSRGNLMDFIGDGRFFFPPLNYSKAGMATLRLKIYICFQIDGAG